MRSIRSFMILFGLSLTLFAQGVGAKAQTLYSTQFVGTFTLPFEVQWGGTTLPVGDYTLRYGLLNSAGFHTVEIVGKAEGAPHAWIQVESHNRISESKNALVCIRTGRTGLIRTLELGSIDTGLTFSLPSNWRVLAQERPREPYPPFAGRPTLIQRVPITPSGK